MFGKAFTARHYCSNVIIFKHNWAVKNQNLLEINRPNLILINALFSNFLSDFTLIYKPAWKSIKLPCYGKTQTQLSKLFWNLLITNVFFSTILSPLQTIRTKTHVLLCYYLNNKNNYNLFTSNGLTIKELNRKTLTQNLLNDELLENVFLSLHQKLKQWCTLAPTSWRN